MTHTKAKKLDISFFDDYLNMIALFIYSMRSFLYNRKKGRKLIFDSIVKQIYFTGVQAMTVISVIAILIGGVVIFISSNYLSEGIVGRILLAINIQYVGPIIIMIMIVGRSGTAISTELGNMKVNQEFEALEVMGIDILHFIVAPRIIGMTISIVCLSIFFSFISILGGALVLVNLLKNFSLEVFFINLFNNLEVKQIIDNLLKQVGFGIIISTVCCYQGLQVQRSSTEVPQMTTWAVGRSLVFCFIHFAYITIIFI